MPKGNPRKIKQIIRSKKSIQAADASTVIDMLIVCTAKYWTKYQTRDIKSHIQHYIDWTNTAYQNSLIDIRFRLAHVKLIEDQNLSEANLNMEEVLELLAKNQEVAFARQKYQADMVYLELVQTKASMAV